MSARKIRAVIFDMDGVVVDSLHLHLEAWRHILPEMGIAHSAIDYKQHFGQASRVMLREFIRQRDHGREATHEEIERWVRRKSVLSCDIARRTAVAITGFDEFIRRVRAQRFPTALGSAASREFIDAVFEKLGCREHFDAIVSVDDVAKPKPDPEIFLKAAEKLGVPIQHCLVIEDSHPGIEAAVASGATCCALLTMLQAEEIRGAQVIAKNYDELWQWLGRS